MTLITDFVRDIDENADRYPPLLRSGLETTRDIALFLLQIADLGGDADDRVELARLIKASPHWARGLLRLDPGMVWVLSDDNRSAWQQTGRPGQIWIHWDVLPAAQRPTATSLASFLRDLGAP